MGISEVSDAFAIIVSEESGNINVCHNGKMIFCKDENALRAQIRIHLYGGKEEIVLDRRMKA